MTQSFDPSKPIDKSVIGFMKASCSYDKFHLCSLPVLPGRLLLRSLRAA